MTPIATPNDLMHNRRFITIFAQSTSILGLALLLAESSQAAILAQSDPYNVFIFGTMNESNVDSEGRVAVGGNATLTNYGTGSAFQSNPSSAGNTLVVGGNLSYNGGEVHYGNVVYGGTLSGSVSAPNGTVTQGSVIDFAAAQASLTASSVYWGGLAATGTTTNLYGGSLRFEGTDPNLNVFTVGVSDLNSAYEIKIDSPVGATVLINISGTGQNFHLGAFFEDLNGDLSGITDKQHVVYNFYESTDLSIGSVSVKGSVLAPFGALNFTNGNIEGNVIANSLTGNGEAHNFLFSGSLPSAVPEPSALALSLPCLLGLVIRRRRH